MPRAATSVADPLVATMPEAGPSDPEIDFDALEAELALREAKETTLLSPGVLATPDIDPSMDVDSRHFNPATYFSRQEKEVIVIMLGEGEHEMDPERRGTVTASVSINGYQLDIKKGIPTLVPKDFATYLVWIGAAYRFNDADIARPSIPLGAR